MRYLFTVGLIAMAFLISSCECGFSEGRGSVPGSPFGTPDDKSEYVSGDYKSVTYTYYCYNGKYQSVTYSSLEKCEDWEKSTYTSDCIGQSKWNEIKHLPVEERNKILGAVREE